METRCLLFFQSVFQAGGRIKGKGQRMKGKEPFLFDLLLGSDAIPHLHLASQNDVMWPPSAVREPEDFSPILKLGRFLP